MRIRGTLLKALGDQLDPLPHVDPAGLTWADEVPVTWEFDHNHPIGVGRVERMDDGSLEFEAEIPDDFHPVPDGDKFAIGIMMERRDSPTDLISAASIFGVGLTRRHADPEQPGVRIVR